MPDPSRAGAADSPAADERALRDLEDRLQRATAAAERLLSETAARTRTAAGGEVPPAGWQRAGGDAAAGSHWIDPGDAARLLATLSAVLDRVPLELQQRVVGALRELLLAVRALVDWCLERAERRRAAPVEVQDIPIL